MSDMIPGVEIVPTTEYSDVHIRMIHLRQANKREDDLAAFRKLQNENLFTDMTLVLKGGQKISVHSLVFAANSKYLKPWMESTFVPDLNYTVILPDVEFSECQALCQILYGLDLSMSRSLFANLEHLAQFLGITMDVKLGEQEIATPTVWQNPVVQNIPDNSMSASSVPEKVNAEELAKALTKDLTNIVPKVLAKAAEKSSKRISKTSGRQQVAETVSILSGPSEITNVLPAAPPICCWHCSESFGSLDDLQKHLKSHKGESPKNSKKHKCQKCKKLLPSMWKLRLHLLTHKNAAALRSSDRRDHQYAGTSPDVMPPSAAPKSSSDHLYASMSNAEATPPASQFTSGAAQSSLQDHAYNSRQMEPVVEQVVHSDRYDHLYSTRKQAKYLPAQINPDFSGQIDSASADAVTASTTANDHAYSTLSPNDTPPPLKTLNRDQTGVKMTSRKTSKRKTSMTKTRAAKKVLVSTQKTVAEKNVSFQALGHSYAATPNQGPKPPSSKKKPVSVSSSRRFLCEQCDRIFPQLYRLKRHTREVHNKERPHMCSICDKSFFKITSLQRHQLIHSVHEKWRCPNDDCSKTFADQSALKYHVDHKVCSKERKKRTASK